jgi:hypothetical protein
MKFLAHESLSRRQIGVLIFQFRTFLDCFDGVIFRAHAKTKRYKSYYGSFGYYVDAFSDILGGTCLMIGCLLYFYKQRPVRTTGLSRSHICSSPSISDNGCDETDLMVLNVDDESVTRLQLSSSNNEISHSQLESKDRIFMTLVLFSLRYSLAAMFWDRNVHAYEDLLDSRADTLQQEVGLPIACISRAIDCSLFTFSRHYN